MKGFNSSYDNSVARRDSGEVKQESLVSNELITNNYNLS